jgi:hypothetical protein
MDLKLSDVARSCGFAAALATIVACAPESKTPTSTTSSSAAALTAAQPAKFTLAPPVGTRFTRTETRNHQLSIVGTPIAGRDELVLRWQVDVGQYGDQYAVSQKLRHITMTRNDTTVVDGDVTGDAIAAQLVIDRSGKLVNVHGLENTSQTLRALAGSNNDESVERALSPANLKTLVAMRYDMLAGDIAGRPTTPGSSWTIAGRPNTTIQSKTLSVEQMEPCDKAQCARIREDIKLDPVAVFGVADELVKRRVGELGGDPSKTHLKSSMYSMSGSLLIEPATMLNHDASLAESGRFVVATDKQQSFEVAVTGSTRYTYDYGTQPVAQADSP